MSALFRRTAISTSSRTGNFELFKDPSLLNGITRTPIEEGTKKPTFSANALSKRSANSAFSPTYIRMVPAQIEDGAKKATDSPDDFSASLDFDTVNKRQRRDDSGERGVTTVTSGIGTPINFGQPSHALIDPIQFEQAKSVAIEQNTTVITLSDDTNIQFFEPVDFTKQTKQLYPVSVTTGIEQTAGIAIVSTQPPKQPDRVKSALQILSTFQVDGHYVQVSRRGVALHCIKNWIKDNLPKSNTPQREIATAAVLDTIRSALSGLNVMHQSGVAHMDIKLSNIVLTKAGGTLIDAYQPPSFGSSQFDYDKFCASPSKDHTASSESDIYSIGLAIGDIGWLLEKDHKFRVGSSELSKLISKSKKKDRSERLNLEDLRSGLSKVIQSMATEEEIATFNQELFAAFESSFEPNHPEASESFTKQRKEIE